MGITRPRLLFFTVIIAAIGGFLFGYNTSIIAGALLFIREEMHLSLAQQSFVVSALILGAFGGVLMAGQLADRLGRRVAMIVATILITIGGLFLLFTHSLLGVLMGRVIVGVGVGVTSLVSPLYIAEVVDEKRRGAYVTFFQIAVTLGVLDGYLASFFLAESANWHLMFGLTMIPAILQFVGLLGCPDSPSYLIAQGKGATRTLKRLGRAGDLEKIEEEMRRSMLESGRISWRHLFQKPLIFALIAGVGMALLQQLCGINTVIYYAPHIFQISGFANGQDAINVTLGIGLVNFFATFIPLVLLDKWGRKPLLYMGFAGMFATLITLSIALFVNSHTMPLLTSVNLMLYVAFFAASLGPIVWVVISEIFPLRMRGRAMSLALLANWIANLFVSSSFLHMVEGISLSGTFLLYGIIALSGVFFVYFLVPETKGKTLEQIEGEWRSNG